MSIARMMSLGGTRELEITRPGAVAAADEAGKKTTVDTAMEKITAFIPSDVIGIYVAGLGVFSPQTDANKWYVFGVSVLLIPVLMLLNYFDQKKRNKPTPGPRIVAVLVVLALVAFVAWAGAMPGTPFLVFTPYATEIGGWAVVILALIMYKLADLLDIVPKT
jgi:quinol-cytochrome oxidoreductase complex cytochrome b subunit